MNHAPVSSFQLTMREVARVVVEVAGNSCVLTLVSHGLMDSPRLLKLGWNRPRASRDRSEVSFTKLSVMPRSGFSGSPC